MLGSVDIQSRGMLNSKPHSWSSGDLCGTFAFAGRCGHQKAKREKMRKVFILIFFSLMAVSLGCGATAVTPTEPAMPVVNDLPVPGGLRVFKIEVLGPDRERATWLSVKGATHYHVTRDRGQTYKRVEAPATVYEYVDTAGSLGETFSSYQVRACNETGCSPFGESVAERRGRDNDWRSFEPEMLGDCSEGMELYQGEGCQVDDSHLVYIEPAGPLGGDLYDACLTDWRTLECSGDQLVLSEDLCVLNWYFASPPENVWRVRSYGDQPWC